jgi:hypothetical protein
MCIPIFTNVIEKVQRAGKTYFIIRDFDALRVLFGQLLGEGVLCQWHPSSLFYG